MATVSLAIKAVGEACKSFFDWLKQTKLQQSESTIIEQNKRLKAATNIAEKIFVITDRYVENHKYNFNQHDYNKYYKLRAQFDKKD